MKDMFLAIRDISAGIVFFAVFVSIIFGLFGGFLALMIPATAAVM